jgi:hypothetical protein
MTSRLDNIEAQLDLLTKLVDALDKRVTAVDGGPVEVRHGGYVPDGFDEVAEVSLLVGQRLQWTT